MATDPELRIVIDEVKSSRKRKFSEMAKSAAKKLKVKVETRENNLAAEKATEKPDYRIVGGHAHAKKELQNSWS